MSEPIRYNKDDIRRHVSHNAYRAGEQYVAWGYVVKCDVGPDKVESAVQGTERNPYRQIITLSGDRPGDISISGSCTCPVMYNCKHVAAALLKGLALQAPSAATSTPAHVRSRWLASLVPQANTVQKPAAAPVEAMPHKIEAWLNALAAAQDAQSEDYPPDVRQRVIYQLLPDTAAGGGIAHLRASPLSARLNKDGQISKSTSAISRHSWQGDPPKHFRPSDLDILERLDRLGDDYLHPFSAKLAGIPGAQALERMLATGRVRWHDGDKPFLIAGPPRPGRIVWRLGDDAALRPSIEAEPGLEFLAATPPVYIDVHRGTIGPVDTGFAPIVAAAVLKAPPIPAHHAEKVGAAITEKLPAIAAVRPVEPRPPRVITGMPAPHLHLFAASMPANHHHYDFLPNEKVGVGQLSFRYDDIEIAAGAPSMKVVTVRDGGVVEVLRDSAAEASLAAALLDRDFVPVAEARIRVPAANTHDLVARRGEPGWLDAMYRDIPELKRAGWRVTIADDFPYRVLFSDGAVDAEIREGSGIDWLELDLGIVVDGERIDLVPAILALIARPGFDPAQLALGDVPFHLPLADGRSLAMPAARLAPIVAALYELAVGDGGGSRALKLSRADAAGLAEFEAATGALGMVWRGGERILQMGARLRAAGGIPPVTLPPGFKGELRPYQLQGVAWLQFLREVGLGGILADDMGLGKTIQALASIAIEKAEGRLDRPVLVIAPTSLMANWRREAERFTPDLKVLTLQGSDRKGRFSLIPESDIVLSTYPLLARDHEVLGEQPWHMVILDEAQTIKNPDAITTRLLGKIDARHHLCLTGTPLENHLGELWSLFSFASPGFLGDRKSFTGAYRTPIEKKGDHERGRLLAKRVKPFLLRRAKAEVANDLPPKTEIAERIELGDAQRDVYESIRLIMHDKVSKAIAEKGFARSRIVILDALLKLRQACCDPRLLKLKTATANKAPSAKLERLNEMLESLIAEGRRILVFSQFTSMLDLIRQELDKAGIKYALLTGDTRDREPVIRGFQDGDVPVFLISLKAGGVGLNLTAADTVIIYDPWWNPAVEAQAIDRAHRIGQDKPVFVHRLVAQGTIEEKMEVLKEKKRHLAESVFDHDGAPTAAMTEDDLNLLLSAA